MFDIKDSKHTNNKVTIKNAPVNNSRGQILNESDSCYWAVTVCWSVWLTSQSVARLGVHYKCDIKTAIQHLVVEKNVLLLETITGYYFGNSWTAVTVVCGVAQISLLCALCCCLCWSILFYWYFVQHCATKCRVVQMSYHSSARKTYWAQVWERFFCWGVQFISITVDDIADMLTWCIKTEFQLMCVSCFIMNLAYQSDLRVRSVHFCCK